MAQQHRYTWNSVEITIGDGEVTPQTIFAEKLVAWFREDRWCQHGGPIAECDSPECVCEEVHES